MKLTLFTLWLLAILLGSSGFAQSTVSPIPKFTFELNKATPTLNLPPPNMEAIRLEDIQRDKAGHMYRIGVAAFTHITEDNAGSWSTQPNGDRVWQYHVKFAGAEALTFLFTTFKIYDNSYFDVFNTSGLRVAETLTEEDVLEHFQKNIPLCFGDEMTLQLTEPAGSRASELLIDRIVYNYRSTGNPNVAKINESGSCQVNVNCSPVGNAWQAEKRGVARIYIVDGGWAGHCSGSLVNNTSGNCRPYFLTAQHCAPGVTAADLNQWVFYFAYEAPNCANLASVGTLLAENKRIYGCVRRSRSPGVYGSGDGITNSDFLLVQLGTLASEAATITKLKTSAINAYWNGWDARNTTQTGGAGIHHPAGDIKKISTYTETLASVQYADYTASTHWHVTWSENANGHGVLEGGSSGSPIFNKNGGKSRIVGTASGSDASCNALTAASSYGKMSYHWIWNGTANNRRLKPFLDPENTGALVLNGSSDPCSSDAPVAPVTEFVSSPPAVAVGGTVHFSDQSSNAPDSWAWSITPKTGWTYSAGSDFSQNPAVTFNKPGQYTVELTTTNDIGSDTEIKIGYITVTPATGQCTATSATCDEFIRNVSLGDINNTSGCTNYASYPATTTLLPNNQYTLTITPQITGRDAGSVYIDDEMAAWIDYNNDLDFEDAGERIAYVLVQNGYSNAFNFTVPESAVSGQHMMRVRLSFSGTPGGDPIASCESSGYGEVEDYMVTIAGLAGMDENSAFAGVTIFPNPATEQLTVDLSSTTEAVSAELLDLTGKVLASYTNVGGTVVQFDLTHFAKGMYQVRLSNGTAQTLRKVIRL